MPSSDPVPPGGKLGTARRELRAHLDDLAHQLRDGHGVAFAPPAIEVLRAAPDSDVHARNVHAEGGHGMEGAALAEGEGYRCKCTFQLVRASSLKDGEGGEGGWGGDPAAPTTTTAGDDFVYVTREDGRIRPLPGGVFPPANRRIRRAMKDLMGCLNRKLCTVDIDGTTTSATHPFARLRTDLTSVTFVTSWGDGAMRPSLAGSSNCEGSRCGGDCLVTLHYGPPGLPAGADDGSANARRQWKKQARMLCDHCGFASATGRSKGTKIVASGSIISDESRSDKLDETIREEGIIRDDLWLTVRAAPGSGSTSLTKIEKVSLVPPHLQPSQEYGDVPNYDNEPKHVGVQYQKPATAFQHPNAGVMLSSLHWILDTISKIANERVAKNASDGKRRPKPRLLEMYCGCGAHTVPLAKSALLSDVVAVELDERLVNACRHNCRLNECLKEDCGRDNEDDGLECANVANDSTMVEVVRGDAADWAKKTLRAQRKREKKAGQAGADYDGRNDFDILLVDPPRDGLSSTVCDMALHGTFRHVIYVSCGRRALLRDLTLLCGDVEGFDVTSLAIIDLFPGTDAVESLVHLKRRR